MGDTAIDMWSFGCILAELYTGYPLFPGENEVEQLACIMEIFGVPPARIMEQASRTKMFFDSVGNPRLVPNSRGKLRRPDAKNLQTVLRSSDNKFVDFLAACLRWIPAERALPEDALHHEWISEGYPRATRPVDGAAGQSATNGTRRPLGGSARNTKGLATSMPGQLPAAPLLPGASQTAYGGFAFPPIEQPMSSHSLANNSVFSATTSKGFRSHRSSKGAGDARSSFGGINSNASGLASAALEGMSNNGNHAASSIASTNAVNKSTA